MDYKKNLKEMRKKYSRKRIKNKVFPKPLWLTTKDGLFKLYEDRNILFKYGEVYYAHLIQANEYLFIENNKNDCPAAIIFSTDPLMEENPEMMRVLQDKIYSYKNMNLKDVPENYRTLAELITDEMSRDSYNFHIYANEPTEIIPGWGDDGAYSHNNVSRIDIRFSCVMVFRNDLPKGVISKSIFPILAAPRFTPVVMVLPKEYWTEEMLSNW